MSQFSNSNKNNKTNRYNNSNSNNGQREKKSGQRTGSGNSDSYRYNQNQPPPPSYNSQQQQRSLNDGRQPRVQVDPRISSLKAQCMEMCSQEERQMRIYNKLVNPLEIKRTAE